MSMLFSIITVTFNAEALVERTLKSVASQSFDDYEHLIIDGNSTDGTVKIADRYVFEDKGRHRIRVVSEPDKGLYDAMNKGLDMSEGRFVCFLNAGDMLHGEDVLSRIAATIDAEGGSDGIGVVYGHTAIVDGEGRFMRFRRLVAPDKLTWKSFRDGMLVCHQSFYINRDIAQRYDLSWRFSADFDWCIRSMREGEKRGMKNVGVRVSLPTRGGKAMCVLTDYLSEGMTTQNHRASLIERLRIMGCHYGWPVAIWQHIWFIIRSIIKK